jgi:predicted nuclease of predicted toxin-antitoxin system
MNIYLDDNLAGIQLINLLVKAGHAVIQPADVDMAGESDAKHFEYAIRNKWPVLTKDCDDFEELHQLILASGGSHAGVLVIRAEHDSTKNMQPKHIAGSIAKLAKSGFQCINNYIVLNHWR